MQKITVEQSNGQKFQSLMTEMFWAREVYVKVGCISFPIALLLGIALVYFKLVELKWAIVAIIVTTIVITTLINVIRLYQKIIYSKRFV